MTARPYYGITGVMNRHSAQTLLEAVESLGIRPDYRLMLGALASYKGLTGAWPTKPLRYPPLETLHELFPSDRRIMSTLHYNSRAGGLALQLQHLVERAPLVEAVQLNIPWPDVAHLRRACERTYTSIILQLGNRAYAEAGGTPDGLVRRLEPYARLVDYVLIDSSGGRGRPFERAVVEPILRRLVASQLPMRWGVAGGLHAGNVRSQIGPLLEIDPCVSFDAEGALRSPITDQLGLDLAVAYLEEVAVLLHGG